MKLQPIICPIYHPLLEQIPLLDTDRFGDLEVNRRHTARFVLAFAEKLVQFERRGRGFGSTASLPVKGHLTETPGVAVGTSEQSMRTMRSGSWNIHVLEIITKTNAIINNIITTVKTQLHVYHTNL